MIAATSIRITVERIDNAGATRRTLHQDFKPLEAGMTIERTVRFMLQAAADKFLDKPKEQAGRD